MEFNPNLKNVSVRIASPRDAILHGLGSIFKPVTHVIQYASTLDHLLSPKGLTPETVFVMEFNMDYGFRQNNFVLLRSQYQNPCMMVSEYTSEWTAQRLIHEGANGYVPLRSPAKTFIAAFEEVRVGKIGLDENMQKKFLALAIQKRKVVPIEGMLTARELEVFRLRGHAASTKDIAKQLHLSKRTVEAYFEYIKDKLDLPDTVHVTCAAALYVAGYDLPATAVATETKGA